MVDNCQHKQFENSEMIQFDVHSAIRSSRRTKMTKGGIAARIAIIAQGTKPRFRKTPLRSANGAEFANDAVAVNSSAAARRFVATLQRTTTASAAKSCEVTRIFANRRDSGERRRIQPNCGEGDDRRQHRREVPRSRRRCTVSRGAFQPDLHRQILQLSIFCAPFHSISHSNIHSQDSK